jgi:hypothetical protein
MEQKNEQATARAAERLTPEDPARNNEENELQAEHESAIAMDSDVPQPPDEDQTTEGQPS